MSEPSPKPSFPSWIQGAILTLLVFQVGLLWMQGSLLERQHGDLQGLRQDMQDLTESLDQFQSAYDQGSEAPLAPSRYRIPARHRALRVRLEELPEGDGGVRKEMEDQRKSEREAVEKARDVREKLSLEENARKAEEKARIEAEAHKYRPLLGWGVAIALLALVVRSWLRKRG